ncbi:MAG: flagellar assembly protein FliW [Candidatus Rokubacteria bacterium]|nr:flagellar assembly protein FliW [Candidatus Rokubacteria bacterium]
MTTLTDTSLIYQSPKLGDVPYTPDDVIRFPHGLPGFERLREFLLVTREECDPFVFLASLKRPEVALPLMPVLPAALGVKAPDETLARLGEAGPDGIIYYTVVSIGLDAKEIIVNLRAPIVINLDTRLGCQVILPDETLPMAAKIDA